MAEAKQQIKFERIHAITSEIIDATDRRTDEFRFHELCLHSQTELKIKRTRYRYYAAMYPSIF